MVLGRAPGLARLAVLARLVALVLALFERLASLVAPRLVRLALDLGCRRRLYLALLDHLAALLALLLYALLDFLVSARDALLVPGRAEMRGDARQHLRPLGAPRMRETRLVRRDFDAAVSRRDERAALVHLVVSARLAERAALGNDERLVVGAAHADGRSGRSHGVVVAREFRDPAGDRAEAAGKQADRQPVVVVAFGAKVGDPHAGVRPHCNEAAVFHAQVHLAAAAGDDRVALINRIVHLGRARAAGGGQKAHVALDQFHLARDHLRGGRRLSLRGLGECRREGTEHQQERREPHIPPNARGWLQADASVPEQMLWTFGAHGSFVDPLAGLLVLRES